MGRRYSVRSGGGGLAGLSSQLAAGDGSAVTVGSGLSLSGGTLAATSGPGSRVAVSDCLLAYYCNETSGTTLANSGTVGSSANLTLNGTAGTSYVLDDRGLYTFGTGALRMSGSGSTDRASVSGLSLLSGGTTATVELTFASSFTYTGNLFEMADATRTNYIQIAYVSGTLNAYLQLGTTATAGFSLPATTGRIHFACVRNGAVWNAYLNGTPYSAAGVGCSASNFPAFTNVTIANNGVNNSNYRGCIADVRVSNVARAQSYLLTAAKTAGSL
jgi:hypothetical protein